ncbi:alpha/beta hydrolase [Campylobacter sp. Marseille-Q3452]|uniref:Alpha/beta hydrolase n=1 Tax=Campylobacter massiliensis TaxID=2762557 RepID=A0A842J8F8_9BACT|nr:alpha/beta hydrolase [Campylobacter massiliensis]MBC2883060.1 alpha/beta hydrolase [Campylobacter massiliensis]
MKDIVVYIHGKGGSAQEAAHFQPLFADSDVLGFDYEAHTPWEAKEEFAPYFESILKSRKFVTIVASSIGAFFAMHALRDMRIKKAYFISPIVNMENLILNMLSRANASEEELRDKGELSTKFGEKLSWRYLCYVREHPIFWTAPTHILYGENDDLTSFETICEFANQIGATLTVMKNGEHRFGTAEQMRFLDDWIRHYSR